MKPDPQKLDIALRDMMETLASVEHERWSHWQSYMHSKGALRDDGSLVLPADLVKQWQRLIETPYSALTEKEKKSDREQVLRYLPVIAKTLADKDL